MDDEAFEELVDSVLEGGEILAHLEKANAKKLAQIAAMEAGTQEIKRLRGLISQLEGELAGIELMNAEGDAFVPEVVRQLQERITELEGENQTLRQALAVYEAGGTMREL